MRVSHYSRIIIRMTVIILLAPSIAFIAWYMSVDLSKNDRFSHVCWRLVWLAICCCYRWSFPLSDCSKVDTLRRCRLSRQSGHRSACYPRQAGEATSSLNGVSNSWISRWPDKQQQQNLTLLWPTPPGVNNKASAAIPLCLFVSGCITCTYIYIYVCICEYVSTGGLGPGRRMVAHLLAI